VEDSHEDLVKHVTYNLLAGKTGVQIPYTPHWLFSLSFKSNPFIFMRGFLNLII